MHDGDNETQFKYEIVKLFQKDILARQLEEGMRIENQTGISLNSQNEWQAPAVDQVGVYKMHRHWGESVREGVSEKSVERGIW